jgi:hypothetical protein
VHRYAVILALRMPVGSAEAYAAIRGAYVNGKKAPLLQKADSPSSVIVTGLNGKGGKRTDEVCVAFASSFFPLDSICPGGTCRVAVYDASRKCCPTPACKFQGAWMGTVHVWLWWNWTCNGCPALNRLSLLHHLIRNGVNATVVMVLHVSGPAALAGSGILGPARGRLEPVAILL